MRLCRSAAPCGALRSRHAAACALLAAAACAAGADAPIPATPASPPASAPAPASGAVPLPAPAGASAAAAAAPGPNPAAGAATAAGGAAATPPLPAAAAAAAAAAGAGALPAVGADVEIYGLRSPSLRDFNGLKGKVVGHKQGRIGVMLPAPHGTKGFLPENVRAAGTPAPAPEQKQPSVPATPAPAKPGADASEVPRNETWLLPDGVLKAGFGVALDRDDGSSKPLTTATAVEPYTGPKVTFQGMWWVMTSGGKQKLRDPKDLRAHPARGLRVNVTGVGTGVVLGTFDPALAPPEILANLSNATAANRWWVRFDDGKERPAAFTELTPEYKERVIAPAGYVVGDRVEVRDKDGVWKPGVVTSPPPDLRVQVDGWSSAHHWEQVRRPVEDSTVEKSPFQVGDRVEVRDADDASWRPGTVAIVSGLTVKVKVDGWKNPHRWKQIKKVIPKDLSTPAPPMPNFTWPVNMTAVWEKTCRIANCASAGMGSDKDCEDSWICLNTTGCGFDVLDRPPCSMRRLEVGDVVVLAPGAHDQGSIKATEVGVVVQDARDEQPFTVRGPYTDTYHYTELEVFPAWSSKVTWAPEAVRSIVMSEWKGAPTFGADGEKEPGDAADSVIKKGGSDMDYARTPAPTPGLKLATPQPPTPKPTPAPPPPPAVQVAVPVPQPVAVVPAPAPAPVPVPLPVAGGGFGSVAANPNLLQPSPGSVIIVSPEMPAVTGIYRVSGKHRGAILYKSASCESKTCVLFVSGGSFWMASPEATGHARNVGVIKTTQKVLGKPPHAFVTWEYHDRESKRWTVSPNIAVDTADGMEKRGIDWRRAVAEHSGIDLASAAGSLPELRSAPAVDPNEKRIDPSDGKAYTMSEFVAFYHGTAEWEKAIRIAGR